MTTPTENLDRWKALLREHNPDAPNWTAEELHTEAVLHAQHWERVKNRIDLINREAQQEAWSAPREARRPVRTPKYHSGWAS